MTLAESGDDFRAFVLPAYRFAHETPDRVPPADWYGTLDGKQRGFRAAPSSSASTSSCWPTRRLGASGVAAP